MNITGHIIRAAYRAASDRPRMERGLLTVLRRHFHEEGVVERFARLQRFAGSINGREFVWGRRDCALVLADWLIANGIGDVASDLRGAYGTEAECKALLAARGGLVRVVAACAAETRLKPAHEPRLGAVGVIGSAANANKQWGAIWMGRRWLMLAQDPETGTCHFAPVTARPLAMWGID